MLIKRGLMGWPYKLWQALAYTVADVVYILTPFHLRILGGLGRVWHELEHALDADWDHHPWYHFCIRSKFPYRLPIHAKASSKAQAAQLLDAGALEV